MEKYFTISSLQSRSMETMTNRKPPRMVLGGHPEWCQSQRVGWQWRLECTRYAAKLLPMPIFPAFVVLKCLRMMDGTSWNPHRSLCKCSASLISWKIGGERPCPDSKEPGSYNSSWKQVWPKVTPEWWMEIKSTLQTFTALASFPWTLFCSANAHLASSLMRTQGSAHTPLPHNHLALPQSVCKIFMRVPQIGKECKGGGSVKTRRMQCNKYQDRRRTLTSVARRSFAHCFPEKQRSKDFSLGITFVGWAPLFLSGSV